jgi:hypothetical protein
MARDFYLFFSFKGRSETHQILKSIGSFGKAGRSVKLITHLQLMLMLKRGILPPLCLPVSVVCLQV